MVAVCGMGSNHNSASMDASAGVVKLLPGGGGGRQLKCAIHHWFTAQYTIGLRRNTPLVYGGIDN